MAIETYYSGGSASVGAGSTTVTGSGTAWLSNLVQAGDYFAANGLSVRIAAVNSNTSITLATGWPGAALSSSNYEIRYTPEPGRVGAALNNLIALLGGGNLQALGGLALAADRLPYATGTGALGLTQLTAFARTLLDDANQATALGTLGAAAARSQVSQAEAQAGTATTIRDWTAERVRQAAVATIESGANASGSYTKFADGTLICRGNINVVDTGPISFALPASFTGPSYQITGTWILSPSITAASLKIQTKSPATFTAGVTTGTVWANANIDFIAIGRWL